MSSLMRRNTVIVVVHGEAGGRVGGGGAAAAVWPTTAILSPNARRLVAVLITVACLASVAAGGIPRLRASDAFEKDPQVVVDGAEPRRRVGREAAAAALEDSDLHKTGTSFADREQEPQQNSFLADEDVRLSDVGDQDVGVGDGGADDDDDDDDPSARVAPRYMLELYRKFSNDKYSHPIANIVRSFLNINTGVRPTLTTGNRTRIALHTLLFNISSVNRDEEIHLAELRLYAAKKTQRVLVYEVVHQMTASSSASAGTSTTDAPENGGGGGGGDPAGSRHYQLLTTREISRGHGDWETFAVTEVVRRWVRTQATAGHILEVRVDTSSRAETVHGDEDYDGDGEADEEEEKLGEKLGEEVGMEDGDGEGGEEKSAFEPILVVFSNDRKRRKIELRELHEIQSHENGVGDEDDAPSFSSSSSSSSMYSSSTSSVLSGGEEDEEEYEDEDDRDRVRLNATVTGDGDGGIADYRDEEDRGYPPQPIESLSKSTGDRTSTTSPWKTQRRVKRSVSNKSNRRRRAKRNSCRRKPMWVDFGEVQWDRWIIQPQGYQAYECTGQCYFPVGENLTPTKYAMIKSLLHATYPKRVAAACCVPTKLDPISLLYIDEHGTVTYKYKYDGMVVAECGCR